MESNSQNNTDVWGKWIELQKLIKEEITLNEIVEKLQNENLEVIKKNYLEFFKNKIKIREVYDFIQRMAKNEMKITHMNYELIEDYDRVLSQCSDPIEKLFNKFRNNYKLILILIDILEKNKQYKDEIESIVELFTHHFFENHLVQNSEYDEILIFIYLLLEKEIDNMISPSVSWFLNNDYSVIGKILKSYTKKPEVKAFVSLVLNDTILKIENSTENFLELDPKKIAEYIKNKKNSGTKQQSFIAESTKKFFQMDQKNLSTRIRKSTIGRSVKSLVTNQSELLEDDGLTFSIKEGTVLSTKDKKATVDLYLEEYEELQQLKDSDNEHNSEYEIELTQEELSNRVHSEKDPYIKDFCNNYIYLDIRQINKISNNYHIFTTKKVSIEDLHNIPDVDQAFHIYRKSFERLKDYCDEIFKNLIEKMNMMPYVMRCICKMIHLLISRKFNGINIYDRNAFIAEFIFEKWIMPILASPDYNTVLTSTVISDLTRKNLVNMAKIIRKINRSSFFESSNESQFTMFNHYIIEIMPSILLFYNKLVDINLPRTIDEIFNKKIVNFNNYQYFKENPDELINIQTMCFSSFDIVFLYKLIKQNLEQFSDDNLIPKIIEKLSNQEGFLNQLVKNENKQFFLIFQTEYNPEKKKILKPEVLRFTFNNDIANTEFRLKRIKFCIKLVLRGINLIDSNICSQYSTSLNTERFFLILNKIIQLEEYSDYEFNDKIPLNWYSLYLNSNLLSLTNDYKANDYKKLYDEILQDETKEIDFLNFKSQLIITKYGLNIRTIEKIFEKYKRDHFKVKQIEKFIKIYHFIKYAKIEVCVRNNQKEEIDQSNSSFMNSISSIFTKGCKEKDKEKDKGNFQSGQDENESSISVKTIDSCIHRRLDYLKKLTEGKPVKKAIKGKTVTENSELDSHVSTIQEFIYIFAKFSEIKEDINQGNCKHKIYEAILSYRNIIKSVLLKNDLFKTSKDEEINEIIDDIENYIERKIYKKVYPQQSLDKDKEFFDKTCMLSWITPSHLDINKKYLNEGLWEIAINCLEKMDEEKSPTDKLKCVWSAYRILNNCINFCSGKDENAGVDDIIPILIYIMIKTKPKRMFSNTQFIQTFIHPNKLLANYGFLLTQIELAVEFISNINYSVLKISKEEYEKYMETQQERKLSMMKLRASKIVLDN